MHETGPVIPGNIPPHVSAEVPIAEAADRLGISTEAARKRVQRGTLSGHKRDGAWFVVLDHAAGHASETVSGRQDATPDAVRTPDRSPSAPAGTVDLAPLAELIERQGDEIGRLREAAAIWQVRAMQAEEQLKAIGAGEIPVGHPTASPDGPGAAQPAGGTSGTPAPAPSRWAAWWRRVVGGSG